MNRKSIGKNNRKKGHDAEREIAKEFRDLGYKHCITSREGSRLFDSIGIDLINVPFNVQIKAGIQRNMNPSLILSNMKENIAKNLKGMKIFGKKIENIPKILIWKRHNKQGKKREESSILVIMSWNDFKKIIQ